MFDKNVKNPTDTESLDSSLFSAPLAIRLYSALCFSISLKSWILAGNQQTLIVKAIRFNKATPNTVPPKPTGMYKIPPKIGPKRMPKPSHLI